MEVETFDTLFNCLVFILWFRIWTVGDSSLFFNPHLVPINRISESLFGFLWPLFRRTSSRLVAAILALILLALRGVFIPQSIGWTLKMGFEIQICPAGLPYHVLFSVLSFAIFLFKLWGFSLIFMRTAYGQFDHAGDALHRLSLPFSDLKIELRPLVLAIFGMLLAFLVNLTGDLARGVDAWSGTPLPSLLLRCFISALAGWASVLPILSTLLVVLIIGSWVSLFSSSQGLSFFCREWLDVLMGPLRNFPVRIGMLDLTPLIFIFVIQWTYPFIVGLLQSSYDKLL